MSAYHIEQDEKNDEKINELKQEFPDFICEYLDSLVEMNRSSRTRLSYAYDIQTFLLFIAQEFGVEPLSVTPEFMQTLKPLDIQHYLTFLNRYRTKEDIEYNKHHPSKLKKYHTNSPAGKARKLATVRGLYKYMIRNSLADSNPAMLVQVPVDKKKNNDVLALDNDEVNRMIKGAEDGSSLTGREAKFAKYTQYRDMAIIELLLGTGLRVSEMVGIDLPDINWDNNSIKVFRKEGKEQRVYMTEDAATAVKEYIELERKPVNEDEKALFLSPRNGTRLTVRSVERIVKKYSVNVTNQDIHTHTLRSTYATNIYANTGDIKLVADALGHANLATVSRYAKSGEKNRKRAPGKVDYSGIEKGQI